METERARAVAFVERMQDAMVERRVAFAHGTALFHGDLPHAWSLNLVRVEDDAAELSAAQLLAEVDRLLGGAGLVHRKLELNSEAAGGRLEPTLRECGWKVERALVMAHEGAPVPGPAEDRAEEVARGVLEPKWERGMRTAPWATDEIVAQLLEAMRLRERAVAVRYFAVRDAGVPVAECSLFSDGTVAQVESVHTEAAFRGRGFARAVVSRAVGEARRAGHELVVLLADEEDWPHELYRRLGFRPVGRVWDAVRSPASRR